jgi:hypothetical protein
MRLRHFLITILASLATVRAAQQSIAAREVKLDNVQLHYLITGTGPAITRCCEVG